MAKPRNTDIEKAVMERARRERLKLSATWRSDMKTSPAAVKERRLRADDTTLMSTEILPTIRLGHNYNSLGRIERRARDSVPPSSVVTDIAYPPPAPGRPFPGAPEAQIIAWNLKMLAMNEAERLREKEAQ